MINKNSFVKIMDAMRDYHDGMREFERAMHVQIENNWMTGVLDDVAEALFEDVENDLCPKDAEPLLYDFAFFHDWGRQGDCYVEIDGNRRHIHNAAELYDIFVELKEEQNNG